MTKSEIYLFYFLHQKASTLRRLCLENVTLTGADVSLFKIFEQLEELELVYCEGVTDQLLMALSETRVKRLTMKGSR